MKRCDLIGCKAPICPAEDIDVLKTKFWRPFRDEICPKFRTFITYMQEAIEKAITENPNHVFASYEKFSYDFLLTKEKKDHIYSEVGDLERINAGYTPHNKGRTYQVQALKLDKKIYRK